ncbi:MAG TPA: hypothetical protein VGV35_17815, partial [Bryobacteraceae bacterium]|nr:hypothetical protein [Bryobacteraceae bacterium]
MNASSAIARRAGFWAACFTLLLGVRLCHVNVLWVDEAYGIAAARRMLEGAALYRDVWFDKPPLYAWIYLLWDAKTGLPLRIGGALFALLCCWLAGRATTKLFGPREGLFAAAGMAFFLAFDHPFALLSLGPDLLLIPFALGTVWALVANRPILAASCAAAGLLANAKALLLLPLVLFWLPRAWYRILPAYAITAAAVCLMARGWLEPVWAWGALYASDSAVANPIFEGLKRTANWAGFHSALVICAAVYFLRNCAQRMHLAAWLALGLAMVAAGARFFPRYYFALLPILVVAAAAGVCLIPRRWRLAILILTLAIPAIRFGERHIATLREEPSAMRDLALWADCRDAATTIRSLAHPGDTLFVWGYRPELNVLAALPGATPFLDSQPLTGVIADRHLTNAQPTARKLAERNRKR